MSLERLMKALDPILEHLATLDLAEPEAARRSLETAFPGESAPLKALEALFRQGVEEGWLCGQGGGTARFSRLAKAAEATRGFSIDAVRLSGPGVWHRHTGGEVNLCFAGDGAVRFDARPAGWVVFGPGSDHVPTVSGGAMDILYFLPGGALEWKR